MDDEGRNDDDIRQQQVRENWWLVAAEAFLHLGGAIIWLITLPFRILAWIVAGLLSST